MSNIHRSEIIVKEVTDKKGLKDFIVVPFHVQAHDPHWIAPIELDIKQKLDRKKNPFFEHGEAAYFVAYQNGKPVGRVTAHTDFLHQTQYNEKTGFFGYFEAGNDPEITRALMTKVEEWHLSKGNVKVLGPFNFNINGEMGILIDGFHTSPMLMMNHNPPYYAEHLQNADFTKAKDVFAWLYEPSGMLSPKTVQYAEAAKKIPGLKIRSIEKSKLDQEIKVIMNIFNEAWSKNWGFLPMTQSELDLMAQELKLILDTRLAFVVEVDGEPAAMCVALPNINEALKGIRKAPLPVILAKALWKLKTNQIKGVRLALLGVRPKFQMDPKFKTLSVLMYVEIQQRTLAAGYKYGELSWTLEDNDAVNQGIQKMGPVDKYKVYRIFEKRIVEPSLSS